MRCRRSGETRHTRGGWLRLQYLVEWNSWALFMRILFKQWEICFDYLKKPLGGDAAHMIYQWYHTFGSSFHLDHSNVKRILLFWYQRIELIMNLTVPVIFFVPPYTRTFSGRWQHWKIGGTSLSEDEISWQRLMTLIPTWVFCFLLFQTQQTSLKQCIVK